ncbi:hypothetical protein F2P45_31415 [Massilia sp. CCM 8733]|uniref:Abi-like protein n=1 Tax=Massilia mucilaginosa TaxID=2609282 RepID=A0ABX0P366_9BURK|nr:Abi family protein [Massilia mucilaginosa]NHZ93478.1 hypothetical protein [Massilia mucilaginosa]
MLSHLAAPRLATIQSFFKTTTDKDTLGCYAWNQAIGAGMLPILGDLEVSFRNALHRALSQHYGGIDSYNWMMQQSNPAHAINPAAPALLPAMHKLPSKSVQDVSGIVVKIKGKKPAGYVVTPDDVVAALPFGFWEVLIAGLGHASHPPGIQAIILAAAFPQAPDTLTVPYGDNAFKTRMTKLLKMIRDTRNRIGHHDSLWGMPEFDLHGIVGFIPRRPRHTVVSLRLFADRIRWFAGWIDPGISRYIQNSDHWWSLQALLHRRALAAYRQLGGRAGSYRAVLDAAEYPRYEKSSLRTHSCKFRRPLLALFY